jgi:hypothetical protein
MINNIKMTMKRKVLETIAVIHLGNYAASDVPDVLEVLDDCCPCCKWCPPEIENGVDAEDAEWILGELWKPGAERGIGSYFQVFHCQSCGLVYATHVN